MRSTTCSVPAAQQQDELLATSRSRTNESFKGDVGLHGERLSLMTYLRFPHAHAVATNLFSTRYRFELASRNLRNILCVRVSDCFLFDKYFSVWLNSTVIVRLIGVEQSAIASAELPRQRASNSGT